MKPRKREYHTCPNLDCQSSWGIEEISFQECDSCGWPDVDDDEPERDEYPDDDYDYDDDGY